MILLTFHVFCSMFFTCLGAWYFCNHLTVPLLICVTVALINISATLSSFKEIIKLTEEK